ncbi:MAG: NADH-quinone oxidoreductase subunit NuoH [Candidatus Omnitrophica bacterium]|nr:NADH-quinone oxidoreductase subunit NuoH [Candidatus Omnitrophota bacterium]
MRALDQIFVQFKATVIEAVGRVVPEPLLPWCSMAFNIAVIAAIAPVIMMYLTWLERKVVARMQNRIGPNRVGLFGLGQPIADGIKMLTKEDVIPERADRLLHFAAPVLAVIPALLIFAVLPFGRNMVAVDLNAGLLYFLAVSSLGTFAVFLGGWASRSKFSLLGGMRSVAQLISYEVPMVLSVVAVVMATGTLSTVRIVEAQRSLWFLFTPWGLVAFGIFFLSGTAEANRTPFDLPEAESEIVAGFHTEYSGMKFALFYMGEFLSAFAMCGLAATLFLGGWQGPGLPSWAWFLLKTYGLFFVLIWFRGTLPRLRVDQLMGLAWKFLLPLALVDMLAAGLWVLYPGWRGGLLALGLLSVCAAILILANAPPSLERRVYRYAE